MLNIELPCDPEIFWPPDVKSQLVIMAESLHCSPETTIALLIGYTPMQSSLVAQTVTNLPVMW